MYQLPDILKLYDILQLSKFCHFLFSMMIDKASALIFPAPKPLAPFLCITSMKNVSASKVGFVNICNKKSFSELFSSLSMRIPKLLQVSWLNFDIVNSSLLNSYEQLLIINSTYIWNSANSYKIVICRGRFPEAHSIVGKC